ncbi:hypothetical protein AX16_002766 [Volvariella volvacea WC 439]|nr:hypothetical protein AX16_002766 [Volvariella volvacea WC 439]
MPTGAPPNTTSTPTAAAVDSVAGSSLHQQRVPRVPPLVHAGGTPRGRSNNPDSSPLLRHHQRDHSQIRQHPYQAHYQQRQERQQQLTEGGASTSNPGQSPQGHSSRAHKHSASLSSPTTAFRDEHASVRGRSFSDSRTEMMMVMTPTDMESGGSRGYIHSGIGASGTGGRPPSSSGPGSGSGSSSGPSAVRQSSSRLAEGSYTPSGYIGAPGGGNGGGGTGGTRLHHDLTPLHTSSIYPSSSSRHQQSPYERPGSGDPQGPSSSVTRRSSGPGFGRLGHGSSISTHRTTLSTSSMPTSASGGNNNNNTPASPYPPYPHPHGHSRSYSEPHHTSLPPPPLPSAPHHHPHPHPYSHPRISPTTPSTSTGYAHGHGPVHGHPHPAITPITPSMHSSMTLNTPLTPFTAHSNATHHRHSHPHSPTTPTSFHHQIVASPTTDPSITTTPTTNIPTPLARTPTSISPSHSHPHPLTPHGPLPPQPLSPGRRTQPPRSRRRTSTTDGNRKKNMMDERARKEKLENDEWAMKVEAKSVQCKGCKRVVSLDKRSRYYPGLWEKHKSKCMEIKRLMAARAQQEKLKADQESQQLRMARSGGAVASSSGTTSGPSRPGGGESPTSPVAGPSRELQLRPSDPSPSPTSSPVSPHTPGPTPTPTPAIPSSVAPVPVAVQGSHSISSLPVHTPTSTSSPIRPELEPRPGSRITPARRRSTTMTISMEMGSTRITSPPPSGVGPASPVRSPIAHVHPPFPTPTSAPTSAFGSAPQGWTTHAPTHSPSHAHSYVYPIPGGPSSPTTARQRYMGAEHHSSAPSPGVARPSFPSMAMSTSGYASAAAPSSTSPMRRYEHEGWEAAYSRRYDYDERGRRDERIDERRGSAVRRTSWHSSSTVPTPTTLRPTDERAADIREDEDRDEDDAGSEPGPPDAGSRTREPRSDYVDHHTSAAPLREGDRARGRSGPEAAEPATQTQVHDDEGFVEADENENEPAATATTGAVAPEEDEQERRDWDEQLRRLYDRHQQLQRSYLSSQQRERDTRRSPVYPSPSSAQPPAPGYSTPTSAHAHSYHVRSSSSSSAIVPPLASPHTPLGSFRYRRPSPEPRHPYPYTSSSSSGIPTSSTRHARTDSSDSAYTHAPMHTHGRGHSASYSPVHSHPHPHSSSYPYPYTPPPSNGRPLQGQPHGHPIVGGAAAHIRNSSWGSMSSGSIPSPLYSHQYRLGYDRHPGIREGDRDRDRERERTPTPTPARTPVSRADRRDAVRDREEGDSAGHGGDDDQDRSDRADDHDSGDREGDGGGHTPRPTDRARQRESTASTTNTHHGHSTIHSASPVSDLRSTTNTTTAATTHVANTDTNVDTDMHDMNMDRNRHMDRDIDSDRNMDMDSNREDSVSPRHRRRSRHQQNYGAQYLRYRLGTGTGSAGEEMDGGARAEPESPPMAALRRSKSTSPGAEPGIGRAGDEGDHEADKRPSTTSVPARYHSRTIGTGSPRLEIQTSFRISDIRQSLSPAAERRRDRDRVGAGAVERRTEGDDVGNNDERSSNPRDASELERPAKKARRE